MEGTVLNGDEQLLLSSVWKTQFMMLGNCRELSQNTICSGFFSFPVTATFTSLKSLSFTIAKLAAYVVFRNVQFFESEI